MEILQTEVGVNQSSTPGKDTGTQDTVRTPASVDFTGEGPDQVIPIFGETEL